VLKSPIVLVPEITEKDGSAVLPATVANLVKEIWLVETTVLFVVLNATALIVCPCKGAAQQSKAAARRIRRVVMLLFFGGERARIVDGNFPSRIVWREQRKDTCASDRRDAPGLDDVVV